MGYGLKVKGCGFLVDAVLHLETCVLILDTSIKHHLLSVDRGHHFIGGHFFEQLILVLSKQLKVQRVYLI